MVAIMEVPCCSGMVHMARQAARNAKIGIPIEAVVIGRDGRILGCDVFQPDAEE